MRRLHFKRDEIILFSILILIIATFFVAVYVPQRTTLTSLEKELDENTKRLGYLRNSQFTIGDLVQQETQSQYKLNSMKAKLIGVSKIPDFLITLYAIISDFQLLPKNIILGNQESKNEIKSVLVNFSAEGSGENIQRLIQYFENYSKEVSLDNIVITPQKDTFSLIVALKVYLLEEEAPPQNSTENSSINNEFVPSNTPVPGINIIPSPNNNFLRNFKAR